MYTCYYVFVLIYNQTSGRFAFCLSRVTIIVTKNNNMLFLTRKYKLQQFIFYMKMNKTYYIRYNVMFSIEHYLFKLSHDARHQELAGADWSILAPFIFSERMWKWTRSSCCKIKNLERRIALLIGIWYLERGRDIKVTYFTSFFKNILVRYFLPHVFKNIHFEQIVIHASYLKIEVF